MSKQEGVDITKCSPQQLEQLGKAIETELNQLTISHQQLDMGARKFNESMQSLAYLAEHGGNKEVMVPLTASLYVPGTIDQNDRILVEVGASYFVEQENKGAQNYCLRKKQELEANAKKIHEIIQVKKVQMQKINNQMSVRMAQYQAAVAEQQRQS